MWTRAELKMKGKAAFKANFFFCVVVALILVIVNGGFSAGSGAASGINFSFEVNDPSSISNVFDGLSESAKMGIGAIVLGFVGLAGITSLLLSIFLFNPVKVSCRKFFFSNSYAPAQLNELKYSFSEGRYGNVVKVMFLRDLFVFLWTLLFIIPGIVKSYQYRMVPYILAEDPFIDYKQALELSKNMMNGQKWRTFVLDISFIGWYFLAAITFFILGVLYVEPYVAATDAELYRVLRQGYVNA